MASLPSGTVTFLFTDVEGSTKLLHELGAEAYAEALAEHRRVIREACAAEGGVEVDTQGDAFFFAFPTAPGALAAAEAMTEALATDRSRCGSACTPARRCSTEEGYVGDDVHFARTRRLLRPRRPGRPLAATAELVELELTDLGEHRLKDIAEAVPIFQLGDGSFPPLKTISNTNLPRPASSFVGRDDELLRGALAVRGRRAPRHAHRPRRHRQDAARDRGRRQRSSPSTRRASSGSALPRCATPRSSRRRSPRRSAPRTASPSTSESGRCCSCSTTSSR